MKTAKIICAVLCLSLAVTAFGCGKGGSENPTDSAAPSVSQPSGKKDELNIKKGIEEMTRLDNAKKTQILASDGEELKSALSDKMSSGALFRTSERTSVTLSGEYGKKTVTVNAPSGSLISESAGLDFVLEATGTGGLITDAAAGSIYVKGENIPLTLKAGADAVYVYGKNCTVTLKGGEYPSVTVLNTTAVIENKTENDITVTLANGAGLTVKAGETCNFADSVG